MRATLGRRPDEKTVPPERQRQIANLADASHYGNGDAKTCDGWLFRGRGLKQITFSDHYRQCGRALGVDLIANPYLLVTDDTLAARSAAWFWTLHGCNEASDRGDFVATTRIINGPALAGQAQRETRWVAAKNAFDLA